jgi:hypothetical protein
MPLLGPGESFAPSGGFNPLGMDVNAAADRELGLPAGATELGRNIAGFASSVLGGNPFSAGLTAANMAGLDPGLLGDLGSLGLSIGRAIATGGVLGPIGALAGFAMSRNNDPGLVSNALARRGPPPGFRGDVTGDTTSKSQDAAIAAAQGLGLSNFGTPGLFGPGGFYGSGTPDRNPAMGEAFARANAAADAAADRAVGRAADALGLSPAGRTGGPAGMGQGGPGMGGMGGMGIGTGAGRGMAGGFAGGR